MNTTTPNTHTHTHTYIGVQIPLKLVKCVEGGHDTRPLTWSGIELLFAVAGEVLAQTVHLGHRETPQTGPPVGHLSAVRGITICIICYLGLEWAHVTYIYKYFG